MSANYHLAFSYDAAKRYKAQNTFEEMEKNLGRLYLLVNAAGINRDSLLAMIQHQRGSIVTRGHTGFKDNSGQSLYSVSKGRCSEFAYTFAKEVTRKKIAVNVDERLEHVKKNTSLGRFGEPIDVHIFSLRIAIYGTCLAHDLSI
ncbi:unnamed protein product [Nyctereutes procyonoides]|uniref:(raccoon dog) hypothetical protein n=1 Tax=Nyctereutes procyonoides TaxID=34880 RepID=A0A811YG12_NYCPR|nr:unnamed protein product [Nyctereutes procyonoides]